MRNAKIIVYLGAFVAFVGVPGLSVAEDDCSGYYVQIGSTQVELWNNTNDPRHMSVGHCVGGGQQCTYKDKDGDSWTDVSQGGANKGTWKTVIGTGKYVSATKNSGWWETKRTELGGPDGPVYIGTFGRTCKHD